MTSFNIHDLVHHTIDVLGFRAKERQIKLKHKISDKLPKIVIGDPQRLRQIFLNLLGNALKFSEVGKVVLTAERGAGDELLFSVSDRGIGIEPEKLDTIFQPFSQADASTTRRFGGTGLGLTICQRLIHKMNGRIWVESEVGKGSTFSFTAQLPKSDGKALKAIDRRREERKDVVVSKRELSILVADDAEDNLLVIKGFLKSAIYRLEMARNGQEAVEKFTKGRYDLVLMDIQMPQMDGYEATRRIREHEKAAGLTPVPIIALTAHAMADISDKIIGAGCNLHLTKPIRKKRLISIINQFAATDAPPGRELQTAIARSVEKEAQKPQNTDTGDGFKTVNMKTMERLRRDLGDDIDFSLELFMKSLPERLAAISSAIDGNDARQLGEVAHKLKGPSATFGADKMVDLVVRLGKMAKDGDMDECAALLSRIEVAGKELELALRELIKGDANG